MPPDPDTPDQVDAYAAFRLPSFRHYLTGNFIFLVGLAAAIFGLGLIGAAIGAARDRSEPAPSPGT